jgi:hypothetical protein
MSPSPSSHSTTSGIKQTPSQKKSSAQYTFFVYKDFLNKFLLLVYIRGSVCIHPSSLQSTFMTNYLISSLIKALSNIHKYSHFTDEQMRKARRVSQDGSANSLSKPHNKLNVGPANAKPCLLGTYSRGGNSTKVDSGSSGVRKTHTVCGPEAS